MITLSQFPAITKRFDDYRRSDTKKSVILYHRYGKSIYDVNPEWSDETALKYLAGKFAVQETWEKLCQEAERKVKEAAEAKRLEERERRTARELLRLPTCRKELQHIVNAGRKYSQELDYYATRKVIAEARELMVQRLARRSDYRESKKIASQESGRIARLVPTYKANRERKKLESWKNRVTAGKLGLSRVRKEFAKEEFQKHFRGEVSALADGAVKLIVAAVGTIGEQAERDLDEMETSEDFSGKKGKHHKLEKTVIERLEVMPDWSAVLLTFADIKSFGSSGFNGYEKVGGVSYRCFLIVRDSTTGEAHIMRVPPKFGNSETQFFNQFPLKPYPCNPWKKRESHEAWRKRFDKAERINKKQAVIDRIQSAIGWTFDLKPGEYQPAKQA